MRNKTRQALEIVDPEANCSGMLARELARKPPAHGRIAEVVYDATEYVPAAGRAHEKE